MFVFNGRSALSITPTDVHLPVPCPSSPFLETLCDYLYDYLRPRTLHEQSITVLCQICTVVQALMVLDSGDDSSSTDSDGEDDDHLLRPSTGRQDPNSLSPLSQSVGGTPQSGSDVSPFTKPRAKFETAGVQREDRMLRLDGIERSSRRTHMAALLRPVLQDAQTRLVFRGQALIVNDVGRFMPTEKDLNYPGVFEKGAFLTLSLEVVAASYSSDLVCFV